MAESQSPQPDHIYKGPISRTGITMLYTPPAPVVDICFVHGFTGDPKETWTYNKRSTESSNTAPKGLSSFLKKKKDNHSGTSSGTLNMAEPVYWPRDLLPNIFPSARVFTFGYDTDLSHRFNPTSKNSLSDHAQDFLGALEDVRRQSTTRPLIFVAHSLGGLLVKDTLRLSHDVKNAKPKQYQVYESTTSIFFFGTPHGGASFSLQSILTPLLKVVGFEYNENIVQTLQLGAERLKTLAQKFFMSMTEQNWDIYTFQEELPFRGLKNKIVEDSSSAFNQLYYEDLVHIHANHVDMCKFKDADDPGFRKVAASFQKEQDKWANEPTSHPNVNQSEEHALIQNTTSVMPSHEKASEILKKLNFDRIDVVFMTLKMAKPETCQWLLNHRSYKSWMDSSQMNIHHGFLWIKGKAGTGKSISMKWLYNHTVKEKKDRIVLRFFFSSRGTDLEYSTEGMYRSLLLQLMKALPHPILVADSLSLLLTLDDTAPWPIEALKEAFTSVLAQVQHHELRCFIDALDECPEIEIRDMLDFFQQVCESSMASHTNISVCLSSRHYPHISIEHGQELVLEHEDDHSNAIRHYIHSQLHLSDNRSRQEIEDEIFDRSSRIFLSARLIVDILNKENDIGGDTRVCNRLREIPRELNELFQDILTRDNNNIEETILCFQWILFAREPLRREELFFAMKIRSGPNVSGIWDKDIVPYDRIDKANLNAHMGLAENFKPSKDAELLTVQFIHESVRDFLLKGNGFEKLLGSVKSGLNLSEGPSHDTLKEACLKQMNERYLLQTSTQDADSLINMPFFGYAFRHVFSHADLAQSFDLDQTNFLNEFPTGDFVYLHNILHKEKSRQYSTEVDLLYLLAERNMGNLIGIHPQRHSSFEKRKGRERFSSPLIAAMAFGNKEAVIALALGAAEGSANQPLDLVQIEEELVRNKPQLTKSISNPRWKKIDVFSVLCSLGSVTLIDAILDSILATMNVTIEEAMKNIQCAINPEVCRYLMAKGLDITAKTKDAETALIRAVKEDELETVEFLLTAHIGPNAVETPEIPSLKYVKSGSMAALLIDHGAYVSEEHIGLLMKKSIVNDFLSALGGLQGNDLIDCLRLWPRFHQQTLLHFMLQKGDKRVLPLLETALSSDSRLVNLKNDSGNSLLKLAALHNGLGALEILCAVNGADFNSRNQDGCTPLCDAIVGGNYPAVETLINLGAKSSHLETDTGCYPLRKAIPRIDPLVNSEMDALKLLLELPSTRVNFTLVSKGILTQHLEIVKLLLPRYRMKMDYRGDYGETLLSTAAKAGNADIFRLLLSTDQGNISVNYLNYDGLPPLSIAIRSKNKNVEIVKLLLDLPEVDVNHQTADCGLSPLYFSIEEGNLEMFQLLFRHPSIDCNLATTDGCTPLYKAVREGNLEIVRLLLSHPSISLNFDDSLDRNPVLWATRHAAPQVVRLFLIDRRVDTRRRCYDGKSILDLAAENGNPDVLNLIR